MNYKEYCEKMLSQGFIPVTVEEWKEFDKQDADLIKRHQELVD